MSAEDDIPQHNQSQFTQNVGFLLQKEGSLLYNLVSHGNYQGESAEVIKQFGPTKARRGENSRYGDTPIMSTPRDQRWVFPENVDWGDLFDRNDLMKQLIDPRSPITTNAKNAMGRTVDEIVLESMFADAKTGKNGGTTTAYPSDNSLDVNIQVGSNADTGFNFDKLRKARRLMRNNHVNFRDDPLVCIISAEEEEDIWGDDKFTNTRYIRTASIPDGELQDKFFQVQFVILGEDELPTNAGDTVRYCPLYAMSGIHLGEWEALQVDLGKDPGKKFNWRLYLHQAFGATRTQEKKVVRINTKIN